MRAETTELWGRLEITMVVILLTVVGLFGWVVAQVVETMNEIEATAAETVVQSVATIQTALDESRTAETTGHASGHSGRADESPLPQPVTEEEETWFAEQRRTMIARQLRDRGISDERVLDAMLRLPRHRLVPRAVRPFAYSDSPQPIGFEQTISQPYIVALMTELVRPRPDSRALDVGTGSGYQTAVLAELCAEVYSIEILQPLAERAATQLDDLGYRNVTVRCGDGYRGWPKQAPFDVIIVAAAPEHVPEPLLEQLALGGRLVIPIGRYHQKLRLFEKQQDGSLHEWTIATVAFVPMTGEALQEVP
jgi:protein-L-isoaspartate(D-aspartate) O-methyltransferase